MAHANTMTCNEELIRIFAANKAVAVLQPADAHAVKMAQLKLPKETQRTHSQYVVACV